MKVMEIGRNDLSLLFCITSNKKMISLSKCNYLIEYDLADSYAIQTQRHGRIKRANSIHKIGYIYQIICEDSWDCIQQKIIAKKENYDTTLIQNL